MLFPVSLLSFFAVVLACQDTFAVGFVYPPPPHWRHSTAGKPLASATSPGATTPPASVTATASATPLPTGSTNNSTYLGYAHGAITYLQTSYSPKGLWPPAGWWNSANAFTLLLDLRAGDSSSFLTSITDGPDGVFQTTLHKAPPDLSKGFLYDKFLDDEGWWTLALIKQYDVTGDETALTAAQLTFADIAANGLVNAPCGGLYQVKPAPSNQASSVITTALFVNTAALLATRIPAQKEYYLNLATTQIQWLLQPALYKNNYIQGDGLNPTKSCTSNGADLSYQDGVVIGGLVALNKATGNATYLTQANTIANALIIPSGPLTDANSILQDPYKSFDGDTAQFKGIFMRNLVWLHQASPNPAIVKFLQVNADSIWTKDRSGDGKNQLGVLWDGPWSTGTSAAAAAAGHISATMALVAAALVS